MACCEVWAQPFDAKKNGEHLPEPHRIVAMLKSFGLIGEKPEYAFPLRQEAGASVKKKLRAAGVQPDRPFFVFCGGGKDAVQRWSLGSYARVFDELAGVFDLPIVALGNAVEQSRYESLSTNQCFHILRDSISLPEMIELLRLAACYIGNDTGPMHVAAAVNTPVAAIMSARDQKGCWYPDVEKRLVIRRDVSCQGCLLRECVEMKHICMTGITAETVIGQLVPFLKTILPR
jgi:ADP-heptose:LPS heptosyltransferase